MLDWSTLSSVYGDLESEGMLKGAESMPGGGMPKSKDPASGEGMLRDEVPTPGDIEGSI